MDMRQAVELFFKRYTDFQGRSRRSEYWWPYLAFFIIGIAFQILIMALSGIPAIAMILGLAYFVFSLALLIPGLAVSFRRLHDLDKSAWFLLIALIPLIGGLYLLYLFCQPGTVGPNQYGPDPKQGVDTEVFS